MKLNRQIGILGRRHGVRSDSFRRKVDHLDRWYDVLRFHDYILIRRKVFKHAKPVDNDEPVEVWRIDYQADDTTEPVFIRKLHNFVAACTFVMAIRAV